MKLTSEKILIGILSGSLLLVSSLCFSKQTEIGIGAIAVDSNLIGKGKFQVNDTVDEGDGIKTGDKGNTTILFNDESMLTLGPDAHAAVEVYEEGKDGKPGRSVIRVYKGQFRYFPGTILQNGGAQFVAVGNKLLGRAAASGPNTPVYANNQDHQNDNAQQNLNKQENTGGKGRVQAGQIVSATPGNGDGIAPAVPSNEKTTPRPGSQASYDAAGDVFAGENTSVPPPAPDENPGNGPSQSAAPESAGVVVEDDTDTDKPVGPIPFADAPLPEVADATPGSGGTGGSPGTTGDGVAPDGSPTGFAPGTGTVPSGGPGFRNPDPAGVGGFRAAPGVGDNFNRDGINAFATSGISGNVAGDLIAIRGAVDVFADTGAGIGFLGTTTASKDIGLRVDVQGATGTVPDTSGKTAFDSRVLTEFNSADLGKLGSSTRDLKVGSNTGLKFDTNIGIKIDTNTALKIDTNTLLKNDTATTSRRAATDTTSSRTSRRVK